MWRTQTIESLITDCLVRILDGRHDHWLSKILEDGFPGFAHMSNQELHDELVRRGISVESSDRRLIADPGYDDAGADDDSELRSLLQRWRDDSDWNSRGSDAI